jgi:HEPN domain-containing protein
LTHDLRDLLEIFEAEGIALPEDLKEVDVLTPFAVESRYPGYWEVITDQDVNEAITLAEKVVEWARTYISKK